MSKGNHIQQVAMDFWTEVGREEDYPRNLEESILWALPICIVKLPRLTTVDLSEWLIKIGCAFDLHTRARRLRACLIAYRDNGFILLDGSDTPDQRRFSLAHEVAHYLLDYRKPRLDALRRHGDGILDVLDGRRAITKEERIRALIHDASLPVHTHLMDRDADAPSSVWNAEDRADVLATELLAPAKEVREMIRKRLIDPAREEAIQDLLTSYFGVPADVAPRYSFIIRVGYGREKSLRQWLGLKQ